MVSEMSSTTQRGAAAAAVVEAWRMRAMLRREVRSSILCAALQPCVSRECSACWTAATTHACNALAMLRTRWFSSRKSHRCVLQTSRSMVRAMLAACKTLASQGAPIQNSQDESSPVFPRRSDKARRFSSPAAQVCGCPSAKAQCRPSQRWNPSAKRSADIRNDGILERLALFQAGTAAADR